MDDASVDLVLTEPGDFSARLTWLKLGYFHAFRGRESTSRIAHMSLVPNRLFVSFPLTSSFVLVWNGVELQLGDIVLHSRGESGHQWTNGTSQWALVSFPADKFADYCRALAEFDLPNRPVGQILRPPPGVAMRLRRLHSKACHLVETKPEIFTHQEAARAVEQEFILALVECLAIAGTGQAPIIRQQHADIMTRFENALRMDFDKPSSLSELCATIDVPERTLRDCCAKFLGVKSGPIYTAATIELCARGAPARRSRHDQRCTDCPTPSFLGTRAFRGCLPPDIWRVSVGDADKQVSHFPPKLHRRVTPLLLVT